MQYTFFFDPCRCMQCFTCVIACKAEHNLRPRTEEKPGSKGPNYREVIQVETTTVAGKVPVQYISMACMHCGSAPCLEVCPAKAIYRDEEFGAVLVNKDLCIGCRYCSWACPFGAPQFDHDGLMQKCDFCIDRLRRNEEPACVEYCCGGAIKAVPVDELSNQVRAKAAVQLVSTTRPHYVVTVK